MNKDNQTDWDGKERRSFPYPTCVLHEATLTEMAKKIDTIHHHVTGNGDPKNGLLYKSQLNTTFRERWEGKFCDIEGKITGLLVGFLGILLLGLVILLFNHGLLKLGG